MHRGAARECAEGLAAAPLARLLAEEFNLPDTAWSVSFQSHFGKGTWLIPVRRASSGSEFHYLPGLNCLPAHAGFLADRLSQHVQGWIQQSLYSAADYSTSRSERQRL